MSRHVPWLTTGLLILIALAAYSRVRPSFTMRTSAPLMSDEPRVMLWAWESPEDLRILDPNRAGVAYLSRELLLGSRLEVRSRHQPLLLPAKVFLTAVVRIETTPSFPWRNSDIPAIAAQIAAAATAAQTRVLQVDFDARASERPYYGELLRELRRQLPRGTALSVTALVSWCGERSWMRGLPIDEAVPMFFRMGGPGTLRVTASRNFTVVREPLCVGSAGVATDEFWPALDSRQRIYVFRPGPWRAEDLASVNAGHHEQLQRITVASGRGFPP